MLLGRRLSCGQESGSHLAMLVVNRQTVIIRSSQNLNANALVATGVVNLELPRGMRDLEADEFANISYVRDKFFETTQLFNFQLTEPSTLEMLATLEAKSGATTANELYTFKDIGRSNGHVG